jgi:hypothetical protein
VTVATIEAGPDERDRPVLIRAATDCRSVPQANAVDSDV